MSAKKKPRNPAAQDATLINIRALKADVKDLQDRLAAVEALVAGQIVPGEVVETQAGLEEQHRALVERVRARKSAGGIE